MEDSVNLRNLATDLQSLQMQYGECVQRDQGLVVRPKATSSTERAFKLKQKYKRMSHLVSCYKSLLTNQRSGRPRLDAYYRNRVGKKAASKLKVKRISHVHLTTGTEAGQISHTEKPQDNHLLTCKSCDLHVYN